MIRTRVASAMAVVSLGFVTAPAASADPFERAAKLFAASPTLA
ncbi:MAG: hypothetical protein NXH97_07590 [Rhodobacteraceae bacterium]|nr:hypothetical protein [Paracoccaceae bacterium]